jgi:hypothetical protein
VSADVSNSSRAAAIKRVERWLELSQTQEQLLQAYQNAKPAQRKRRDGIHERFMTKNPGAGLITTALFRDLLFIATGK